MHQTMKMKNNIPDNIPDCIMQEMIILIMYTRIEDIKSKLGIDVSDNYVPFITAYFPFTKFAFFRTCSSRYADFADGSKNGRKCKYL